MNYLPSLTNLNADPQLEAAVLGSVLADPARASDLLRFITKPTVFSLEPHRLVYQALADLYARGHEADPLAVRQWLRQAGHPELDLMGLLDQSFPFELAPKCLYLFQLAVKRYLVQYGRQLALAASDPGRDALQLLERVDGDIDNLMGAIQGMKHTTLVDHLKAFGEDLDRKAAQEGPVTGLSTGLRVLDDQTNGLKPGGFYVLAAGTGVGKTAFAGNLIRHQLLADNNPVGLFTLEMKGKEILSRLVASMTGYSNYELDRGKDLDPLRIRDAVGRLATAPLYLHDKPVELIQLRYQALEWKRRHGIKLLVIDYLQLVKHSPRQNRYERISEISSTCKEIAQELDIALLALAQLNREHDRREGIKKRPKLSDLRESGQIEQDSDGVMMLFRPARHGIQYEDGRVVSPQTLEIHLPKWRNGVPTEEDQPLMAYYDAPTNRIASTPWPIAPPGPGG